jgi:hypothetical protein
MKTEVSFICAAFNTTETKDYFINDCCFGDDVCRWLIGKLREQGIETDVEPGQEDFGWYFAFRVGGVPHCFVLGFQPNDPEKGDQWLGSIERHAGLLASLFGGRNRGVRPDAVRAIHSALSSSPDISALQWREPRSRSEEAGSPTPD